MNFLGTEGVGFHRYVRHETRDIVSHNRDQF